VLAVTLMVLLSATAAQAQVSISSEKTVGLYPLGCATTDSLTLPVGGGNVTYCYRVTNTGSVSISTLDLGDTELGQLLSSYAYWLAPSESYVYSTTESITVTTTNVASWTAQTPTGASATSTDSAVVTVQQPTPALSLVKTVGTDPDVCAATNQITLPPGGGTVVYCYEVTNTGTVSLTSHDLVDDQLGQLLNGFAYPLAPASSTFITETASIATTTVNSATWTATSVAGDAAAADQAVVTVQQQREAIPLLSPSTALLLALLVCAAGLLALRRLA